MAPVNSPFLRHMQNSLAKENVFVTAVHNPIASLVKMEMVCITMKPRLFFPLKKPRSYVVSSDCSTYTLNHYPASKLELIIMREMHLWQHIRFLYQT